MSAADGRENERASYLNGRQLADQLVRAQADAGMPAERIGRQQEGVIASLLSDAETAGGKAFATGYATTAETYISDLKALDRPEPDRTPGAPHPDPFLAERGWRTCEHGIYVRRQAQAEAEDPEAA